MWRCCSRNAFTCATGASGAVFALFALSALISPQEKFFIIFLPQVSPLVRGPEGTQVHLTIRRPGEAATLQFAITRATIQIPVFDKQIVTGPNGEKIGYMELSSFSATTTRTGVGAGV